MSLSIPSFQSGEIDVVNHRTGDRCHLKFAPYSYFSRDVPRKVGFSHVSFFYVIVLTVYKTRFSKKIEMLRVIGLNVPKNNYRFFYEWIGFPAAINSINSCSFFDCNIN